MSTLKLHLIAAFSDFVVIKSPLISNVVSQYPKTGVFLKDLSFLTITPLNVLLQPYPPPDSE